MEEKISMKSTKETMFQALKQANDKIKELEKIKNNPQTEVAKKHQTEVLKEASKITEKKDLNTYLSEMNTTITNTINSGIEAYNKAMDNIAIVNESIQIKQKELEELYKVEKELLNFSVVVNAQMDQKEKFEKEFKETKEANLKELEDIKKQIIETKETLKNDSTQLKQLIESERKKDEEEYQYNSKRKHKIDEDKWNDDMEAKKKAFNLSLEKTKEELKKTEEALNSREEALVEREKKMKEYEAQIEAMPTKIKEAVDKAVEEAEKSAKRSYNFETAILKKDFEGKIALLESKIETLQANSLKDNETIKELQGRLNDSYKEIKDMAAKSVEGASNQKAYTTIENTLKNLQKSADKN